MTLTANPHYWAGRPAIGTIELVTDIGGRSPVEAFEDGRARLRPDLRLRRVVDRLRRDARAAAPRGPSLSTVQYYGFDTSRAPFDDADGPAGRSRMAVDWRRIAALAVDRPATTRRRPRWSRRASRAGATRLPARARSGRGPGAPRRRPAIRVAPASRRSRLMTGGGCFDEAIVDELERELGITADLRDHGVRGLLRRPGRDPPAMWSLGWVADYPGRNDFLGVLLGTGLHQQLRPVASATPSTPRSPRRARRPTRRPRRPPTTARRPSSASRSRSSRWRTAPAGRCPATGLLGAGQNGLGILRMAGLAWAD